ncbi:MAG: DUF481 domain-containing protein [bacterium]|nr:DUF481 domain-containing protein [bacterium]
MRNVVRLLLMLVMLAPIAGADDIVYLTNGDRLTGIVTDWDSDAIALSTTYAGDVRVNVDTVRAVVRLESSDAGLTLGRIDLSVTRVADDALPLKETLYVTDPDRAKAESIARALAEGRLEVADEGAVFELLPNADDDAEPERVLLAARAGEWPEESKPAPKKWSASVSASALWRKGQTDSFDAAADVVVERRWTRNVLTGKIGGAYGELDSAANTQKAYGELKWQHYLTERFYTYALAGAEHDSARKLDLRLRGAAGLGRDFIVKDTRKLSGDVGAVYTYEYWKQYGLLDEDAAREQADQGIQNAINNYASLLRSDPSQLNLLRILSFARDLDDLRFKNETDTEDAVSLRAALHFKQNVFDKSAFTAELAYEPDIDDFASYRFLSELAFTTPLSNRLDLKVTLDSEYDSEPGSKDIDEWDHVLSTGLQYRF